MASSTRVTSPASKKVGARSGPAYPPPVDAPAASPPPPPVSPARILVVDDERPLLQVFARVLRPHVVELASSGALALARLATLPEFDLVLCDLNLPDINGRDLYRQACALSPELRARFVFMTGDDASNPPDLDDGSSAVRVLSKPFARAELCALLHDILTHLPPRAAPSPHAVTYAAAYEAAESAAAVYRGAVDFLAVCEPAESAAAADRVTVAYLAACEAADRAEALSILSSPASPG